jgi:hypothetical protein
MSTATTNPSGPNTRSIFFVSSMAVVILMYFASRDVEYQLVIGNGWTPGITEIHYCLWVTCIIWGGLMLLGLFSRDEDDARRVRLGLLFVSLAFCTGFIAVVWKLQRQLVDKRQENLVLCGSDLDMLGVFAFLPDIQNKTCEFHIKEICGIHDMVFSKGNKWIATDVQTTGEKHCIVKPPVALLFVESVSVSRHFPDILLSNCLEWFTGMPLMALILGVCLTFISKIALRFGKIIGSMTVSIVFIYMINYYSPMVLVFFSSWKSDVDCFLPEGFIFLVSLAQCFLVEFILRSFIDDDHSDHMVTFGSSVIRLGFFLFFYVALGGCTGTLPYMNPYVFILVEMVWDNSVPVSKFDSFCQAVLDSYVQNHQLHVQQMQSATGFFSAAGVTTQPQQQQVAGPTTTANAINAITSIASSSSGQTNTAAPQTHGKTRGAPTPHQTTDCPSGQSNAAPQTHGKTRGAPTPRQTTYCPSGQSNAAPSPDTSSSGGGGGAGTTSAPSSEQNPTSTTRAAENPSDGDDHHMLTSSTSGPFGNMRRANKRLGREQGSYSVPNKVQRTNP